MAKNSREGNRERAARRRAALAERGLKQILLMAPEQAHPLLKQAAGLMARADDPMEPRAALRWVGGANEPEPGEVSSEMIAEIKAAKARIAAIECEAEARRMEIEAAEQRKRELETERDAARTAEVAEREKGLAATQNAQERIIEALQRAEKAEAVIRRARSLPGVKGRLVRWLTDEVLE